MKGYSVPWTLLTTHVWISLRESKITSQKRVKQGVNTCYKSYIQTFVVLIWMGVIRNTSSPSLMTTDVTCISTYFVLRMKH